MQKQQKTKKIRKHVGIIQTGSNAGKLRKGYRYTGYKTKNGLSIIKKTKKKKYTKKKFIGGLAHQNYYIWNTSRISQFPTNPLGTLAQTVKTRIISNIFTLRNTINTNNSIPANDSIREDNRLALNIGLDDWNFTNCRRTQDSVIPGELLIIPTNYRLYKGMDVMCNQLESSTSLSNQYARTQGWYSTVLTATNYAVRSRIRSHAVKNTNDPQADKSGFVFAFKVLRPLNLINLMDRKNIEYLVKKVQGSINWINTMIEKPWKTDIKIEQQWLAEHKTEQDLNIAVTNGTHLGWKINPSIWKKRFQMIRKTQKIKKREEIKKLNSLKFATGYDMTWEPYNRHEKPNLIKKLKEQIKKQKKLEKQKHKPNIHIIYSKHLQQIDETRRNLKNYHSNQFMIVERRAAGRVAKYNLTGNSRFPYTTDVANMNVQPRVQNVDDIPTTNPDYLIGKSRTHLHRISFMEDDSILVKIIEDYTNCDGYFADIVPSLYHKNKIFNREIGLCHTSQLLERDTQSIFDCGDLGQTIIHGTDNRGRRRRRKRIKANTLFEQYISSFANQYINIVKRIQPELYQEHLKAIVENLLDNNPLQNGGNTLTVDVLAPYTGQISPVVPSIQKNIAQNEVQGKKNKHFFKDNNAINAINTKTSNKTSNKISNEISNDILNDIKENLKTTKVYKEFGDNLKKIGIDIDEFTTLVFNNLNNDNPLDKNDLSGIDINELDSNSDSDLIFDLIC